MRDVHDFITVSASLRRDAEARRWYADGAEACLVLTSRGRLLEPYPIFGPTGYRLLARRVTFFEAASYAFAHGLRHERVVARPPTAC